MSQPKAEIAIIGGTGHYDPEILEGAEEVKVYTPYGSPSWLVVGEYKGKKVAFIPRHGRKHVLPPHRINYKANIWALKELGVTRILAPSAVGSLREELKPGDIVIPSQFIDFTKNRDYTFYEGGIVGHFSLADPFCPELTEIVYNTAVSLGLPVHRDKTYICIEGPRFSTRAESKLYRMWGADVIGMTLIPEAILARELEICYLPITTITDYDVWAEKPVTAEEVVKTLKANVEKVNKLLREVIPKIPSERNCVCSRASKEALV
ncbi:MAG: S-methyl-5'-thioadenosine phosphorylase [Candidatus Methanomethylicota archaeon]|uniref:S-methyl-5'-thioadenosine phosphorylase n=1 Tax=Thermoproteota archaeon TaxID=2056631 RepID=A0A497F0T5_9CREN|nr:MAG: S-methyl-5'-thioadenosine phosphorylase [Candidatus Verstraetearchaeota archaeon]